MVFPVFFLRSFAYAGIAVVGLATKVWQHAKLAEAIVGAREKLLRERAAEELEGLRERGFVAALAVGGMHVSRGDESPAA